MLLATCAWHSVSPWGTQAWAPTWVQIKPEAPVRNCPSGSLLLPKDAARAREIAQRAEACANYSRPEFNPWDPLCKMREVIPFKFSSDLHKHAMALVHTHIHNGKGRGVLPAPPSPLAPMCGMGSLHTKVNTHPAGH